MQWFLICGFSTRRRCRCTKIWRTRTGKINVFVSIRMTRGGAAAAARRWHQTIVTRAPEIGARNMHIQLKEKNIFPE